MQDAPEPQSQASPAETPAPDLSPPAELKAKVSWWWIFPTLLAAYIVYSAIPYRPFAKSKPAHTADEFLNQSLQAAQARRYPECIAAAQEAAKLAPSPEAYNNIGWCSAQMGDWNEGIRNATQALKLKPDMERARNNLLWMTSQRDGKAPVPNARAAPTTPPPTAASPADAALLVSLQQAQAHRYPECLEAAGQAVRLNPRSAEAYNNLGYCSGGLAKWDDAVRYLNEALRLRPDFPLAKGNLSWIQAEKAKADGRARPN